MVEDLRDECQESLDNMPEALQESSSSGELLQERIELCEEAISELESIDDDVKSEEDKEAVIDAIESAISNL